MKYAVIIIAIGIGFGLGWWFGPDKRSEPGIQPAMPDTFTTAPMERDSTRSLEEGMTRAEREAFKNWRSGQ